MSTCFWATKKTVLSTVRRDLEKGLREEQICWVFSLVYVFSVNGWGARRMQYPSFYLLLRRTQAREPETAKNKTRRLAGTSRRKEDVACTTTYNKPGRADKQRLVHNSADTLYALA